MSEASHLQTSVHPLFRDVQWLSTPITQLLYLGEVLERELKVGLVARVLPRPRYHSLLLGREL